jgi:hypothetical protein
MIPPATRELYALGLERLARIVRNTPDDQLAEQVHDHLVECATHLHSLGRQVAARFLLDSAQQIRRILQS